MSEQLANKFIAGAADAGTKQRCGAISRALCRGGGNRQCHCPGRSFTGRTGRREFWTEYRGAFEQAESQFRNVIASEGRAALEWTTEGTSFEGKPLRYSGVTILEISGDKITRSSAYFDPGALGRQMEK